ncbi:hypothetical protein HDU79_000972 [Rhizoclosmatium sp. JEL0117]|nr:hypothetical protein HDU79_000972 [Rhizoclosmatium sp. JEL0117]
MNADLFSADALQILTGSSQYTDIAIWWFANQLIPTQIEVIQGICALNLPPPYILLLLQIMSRTFFLQKEIVTEMKVCLSTLGNVQPLMQVTQQMVCENFNPFTPKCGAYFVSLDTKGKSDLIATICGAISSTRVPRAQIQQTLDYYQSLTPFNSALRAAVDYSCDSGPALCSTHPSSPRNIDWFNKQPIQPQIQCTLNLCANQTFSTPNLADIFNLMDTSHNLVTQSYESSCLKIRDMDETRIFVNFYPNMSALPVQMWFSLSSPENQVHFIDSLYKGTYLSAYHRFPILNLSQLNATSNALISFLKSTNSGSVDAIGQRVSDWNSLFEAYTLPQL